MSNREENIDSCDGKESSCCIDEVYLFKLLISLKFYQIGTNE